MLYSTFTAYLGFAVNEGEYKVMGLASYGRPKLVNESVASSAARRMGHSPSNSITSNSTPLPNAPIRRGLSICSATPRSPYEPIDLQTADGRRFADCAASVQLVLEDTLVEIARALRQETV